MNTRRKIDYTTYFDKVYGCFLGKCIGGTAGGPAEGRKELLDYPLDEAILHSSLPNDDLDLQILYLELIERKGMEITARDMARDFSQKVPYGPGEYGFFLKAYERGIYPHTSGCYNNRYYENGMGCPIRSEIWACIFPGAPSASSVYVEMDGSLDHKRDSIDAEHFLATLEGELFFTDDLRGAINYAVSRLPEGKLPRLFSEICALYDSGKPWQYTRGYIIRNYGHADCTNMYQNMGFTLLSLLYGGENIRETLRLGLACGYDTDCICATAASVLGIIKGAENLMEKEGLTDTGLNIAVGTDRRGGSICNLARDVCRVGICASEMDRFVKLGAVEITDAPKTEPLPTSEKPLFELTVRYGEKPVVSPRRPAEITLVLACNVGGSGTLEITPPTGLTVEPSSFRLSAEPGETVELSVVVSVSPDAVVMNYKNIISVDVTGDFGVWKDEFGIVGCDLWRHYGPFVVNIRDFTHIPPEQGYGPYLAPAEGENWMDVLREYHLGGVADIDREFVPEQEPFCEIKSDGRAETEPTTVEMDEDLFDIAYLSRYEGPSVDYFVHTLISPEERDVELALGHTAPFKLWVNGKLLGSDKNTKWWTAENLHFGLHLEKGENVFVLKTARVSSHAEYSLNFRKVGGNMRQYSDFGTLIV